MLQKRIFRKLRGFIEKVGFRVIRNTCKNNDDLQICRILQSYYITDILDVGANSGQFAKGLILAGYNGQIISFEPLSSVYEELMSQAAKHDNWQVYERCAFGSKNSVDEINISMNSVSSSILSMNTIHSEAETSSKFYSKETVKINTIDSVFDNLNLKSTSVALKIDTQGYEKNVLLGAVSSLQKIKVVIIELSLVELYQGQALYREIDDMLQVKGYHLHAMQKGFTDEKSGRALQLNGIYVRDDA
jgi:FkbM family methyltransferase